MRNGEFASGGKTTERTMSRSWTTAEESGAAGAANGMKPVHPGEILRDELDELGLSPRDFAKALDLAADTVAGILDGRRSVTADTALRLARYLGTTPRVWLNLQAAYDLRRAEMEAGRRIAERVTPREAAA